MPGWVWFFVVVVAIPSLGVTVSEMFKRHLRFKERQLDAMSRDTAERAARYAAQTERLEQRVRVLERIITDRGVDLASQIEDLRERPLN